VAALTLQTARARARAAADEVARVFAQVVFSRAWPCGVFVLLAAATQPRTLAAGLCALGGAAALARLVGLTAPAAEVPYGYNALLVGFAVASAFAFDGASAALAATLGAASVLVTGALAATIGAIGWLPVLSLPFAIVAALAFGAVANVPLAAAPPSADVLATLLPVGLALPLRTLGAVVFVPHVAAGALVLLGVVVHSRIAAMLVAMALAATLGAAACAHAPLPDAMLQSIGANAILVAIAVGGVWLVPSRSSFLLALAAILLAGLFALGLEGPLTRLGMPPTLLPANFAILVVLAAMRQRAEDRDPYLVKAAVASPEDALLALCARRAPHADAHAVAFHLPFRGTWTCTQGANGVFTHKGALQHAYDFEVYGDAQGRLCLGAGRQPTDYFCFRLPVAAAADGTVVATENDVADNAIGDVDLAHAWGNRVVVQHAAGLYSVVAHLARGSVCVAPGQVVRRGDVLGLCGNSGRSPRPHLHFQLQVGPALGSTTLPCRFANVVVRLPSGESLVADARPREGDALRNLDADTALASFFDWSFGRTFAYACGGKEEHVACEIDAWGRYVLRSRELGATLVYRRDGSSFTTYEVTGARSSVLYLLRVALPRVPFEGGAALAWTDAIPERWVGGWARRLSWDFVAPLASRAGIEVRYRAYVDAGRLIVTGLSTALGRRGAPWLRTRAVLGPRGGATVLEVEAGGRLQRAVPRVVAAPQVLRPAPARSAAESVARIAGDPL
jgi:urea transporter